MKFGACLPFGPTAERETLLRMARLAEDAGYESLWATDHVLLPRSHAEPYGRLIEPLISLAWLAGATNTVRLGTSILVLPQRDPILVAKQVAALDILSEGRALLGIGVGWMEEEYRFLRANFHRRGEMADEWIRVLRELWSADPASFRGNWIEFQDAVQLPKPAQSGGPPIFVAGNSAGAIRRAAILGDGWHPHRLTPPELASKVRDLRLAARGRPLSVSMRLTVAVREDAGEDEKTLEGPPSALIDRLGRYEEAGAEHVVAYFKHGSRTDLLHQLESFASSVIAAFEKRES